MAFGMKEQLMSRRVCCETGEPMTEHCYHDNCGGCVSPEEWEEKRIQLEDEQEEE